MPSESEGGEVDNPPAPEKEPKKRGRRGAKNTDGVDPKKKSFIAKATQGIPRGTFSKEERTAIVNNIKALHWDDARHSRKKISEQPVYVRLKRGFASGKFADAPPSPIDSESLRCICLGRFENPAIKLYSEAGWDVDKCCDKFLTPDQRRTWQWRKEHVPQASKKDDTSAKSSTSKNDGNDLMMTSALAQDTKSTAEDTADSAAKPATSTHHTRRSTRKGGKSSTTALPSTKDASASLAQVSKSTKPATTVTQPSTSEPDSTSILADSSTTKNSVAAIDTAAPQPSTTKSAAAPTDATAPELRPILKKPAVPPTTAPQPSTAKKAVVFTNSAGLQPPSTAKKRETPLSTAPPLTMSPQPSTLKNVVTPNATQPSLVSTSKNTTVSTPENVAASAAPSTQVLTPENVPASTTAQLSTPKDVEAPPSTDVFQGSTAGDVPASTTAAPATPMSTPKQAVPPTAQTNLYKSDNTVVPNAPTTSITESQPCTSVPDPSSMSVADNQQPTSIQQVDFQSSPLDLRHETQMTYLSRIIKARTDDKELSSLLDATSSRLKEIRQRRVFNAGPMSTQVAEGQQPALFQKSALSSRATDDQPAASHEAAPSTPATHDQPATSHEAAPSTPATHDQQSAPISSLPLAKHKQQSFTVEALKVEQPQVSSRSIRLPDSTIPRQPQEHISSKQSTSDRPGPLFSDSLRHKMFDHLKRAVARSLDDNNRGHEDEQQENLKTSKAAQSTSYPTVFGFKDPVDTSGYKDQEQGNFETVDVPQSTSRPGLFDTSDNLADFRGVDWQDFGQQSTETAPNPLEPGSSTDPIVLVGDHSDADDEVDSEFGDDFEDDDNIGFRVEQEDGSTLMVTTHVGSVDSQLLHDDNSGRQNYMMTTATAGDTHDHPSDIATAYPANQPVDNRAGHRAHFDSVSDKDQVHDLDAITDRLAESFKRKERNFDDEVKPIKRRRLDDDAADAMSTSSGSILCDVDSGPSFDIVYSRLTTSIAEMGFDEVALDAIREDANRAAAEARRDCLLEHINNMRSYTRRRARSS